MVDVRLCMICWLNMRVIIHSCQHITATFTMLFCMLYMEVLGFIVLFNYIYFLIAQ